MSDKRQTVSTTKYTVDQEGKLQTSSGSSKVNVPQAGFYVNSDVGLTKDYTSQGVGIAEEDVNTYEERNPMFGVSSLSEPQYKYEWLENLWCDKLANPELLTFFDAASFDSEDQASLFEPFSNSIGSLLAIETIKDSANTPVSEMSTSEHIVDSDNATTGTLMYDTVAHVHRETGPVETTSDKNQNRSNIDLTKKMRDSVNDVFNRNMGLIKDPKFNIKDTNEFDSKPVARSDGSGYGSGQIQPGYAHGNNLIADTKHYDRMHQCYDSLMNVISDELKPTMFSIWQYRRGRKRTDAVDIQAPLEIVFPVERVPTKLDGFTFDPVVSYKQQNSSGSTVTVATKPQTNEQILGVVAVNEDASSND